MEVMFKMHILSIYNCAYTDGFANTVTFVLTA